MMSVAWPKWMVDRNRSKWGPLLRYQAKYVRATRNQDRLDSFGFYSSRRRNARQRRRIRHWDRVADRMADKMDRV